MTVKVMIKRRIPKEMEQALINLITRMRNVASRKKGYVSGETLWGVENPDEYLVISTWRTLEDWERWKNSEERNSLQEKIDVLGIGDTTYTIYRYPEIVADEFSDPLM
jgi:heme oxygenase (mycobilin-producing)